MAKKYTGSLTLEWFNKQKSIIQLGDDSIKGDGDSPAPKINWINKDEALFFEINKEEGKGLIPYWVDRNDIRVKEARPLIFQKAFITVDENIPGTIAGTTQQKVVKEINDEEATNEIENILIKGDNLLTLNTLKNHFDKLPEAEKVKCIYIDPPFNTGQAFEYYDDNFEKSEWLSMLRDRLVILRTFLREDGFFVIHLDDSEVHYCKVLMDEIMGSTNFVSHITYERSGVAGLGQGGFLVNTTEHILLYRNLLPPEGNNIGRYSLDDNTIKRYNRILKSTGELELVDEFNSKSNKLPVKIYKHSDFEIETISLANFKERETEIRKIYAKNLNKLFRGNQIQKENSFQLNLINGMDKNCLYSVLYTPSRGKYKDEEVRLYYYNKELLSWLGDNAEVEGDDIVKSLKLTTLWNHEDIPKADIANEGGIDFPRGKKPENLLKRIFDLCTKEGDLILDCFGGSGTSFAVAHKMKRKWIGIEIGNHADSHIIPRLKSILAGVDKLGVTKKLAWTGGGSFKYYHLGESIITVDSETGKGDFNWKLGKQFIQDSLLQSYDFMVDRDFQVKAKGLFTSSDNQLPSVGKLIGKNGSMYALAYLAAPDEQDLTISNEEIKSIYGRFKVIKDFKSLVIYTNKGIDLAEDSVPEDLEIIKVPYAIFAKLER